VHESLTLGERIRELRKRRGLSQRELAGMSGVSVSLVRKLEQGEREDTTTATLRKLAVALNVPTTVLLGHRPQPSSGSSAGTERLTDGIWDALAHPMPALEPVSGDGLSSALGAAVRLYHDNRYADLAAVLPGLLRDAQVGPVLLRSRAYQLAGSLLVQTRQRDAARVALDRSLADAHRSGSQLDAASAVITMCWLLLSEGRFGEVFTLASGWADQVEPKLSVATPAQLAAWGWLLLRASAAAIRDNRPADAAHTMRLAEAAAAAIGPDRGSYHTYWTTFGRATVAMKTVENAVIDDKPGLALQLAERVPPHLRPTSDNRNRHLLDVSHAHLMLRHYGDAFDVLYRLSGEAPVWLTHQPAAKTLLAKIITKRRTLTPAMRELAAAISLPL
jgi:transcriptional regulator with XRE-family HTH domain